MTAWILILIIAGHNSMTSQQVEFKSRAPCEAAAQLSREEIARASIFGQPLRAVAYCLERLP